MKNFRIIAVLAIMMVSFGGYDIPAYGQTTNIVKNIGKNIGKKFAKKTVKKGAKEVAEKEVKEVSKELAEKTIRKSASKALTSKVTKEAGQKAIRETSAKNIHKTFAKSVAKKVDKKLFLLDGGKAVASNADDVAAKAFLKKRGSAETKSVLERKSNNLLKDESTKKAAKKAALKSANRRVGKEAYKALDDAPGLQKAIRDIQKKSSSAFPDENLYVETVGKNRKIGFTGTSTEILVDNKGVVHATAGSTPKAGAMNEFLNNPLPNTTYIVDDAVTYTTDKFGRTIGIKSHSSELSKSVNRTSLDTHQAKDVVTGKGGRTDVHDAGHLQSRSTGGSNESINLLPMDAKAQRSGSKWFKLEEMERQAIARGDDVISTKTITYRPDGTYSIEVLLDVTDKVTGKTTRVKKVFDNLFTLSKTRK